MKTTDTMATPTTAAAIEANISTWRVPVARRQTLDEAKIPDAESLAAGGSEVVMPMPSHWPLEGLRS